MPDADCDADSNAQIDTDPAAKNHAATAADAVDAAMIAIPSYTLGSARLRFIICLLLLMAASMAVVGAIASSRRVSARNRGRRVADTENPSMGNRAYRRWPAG